MSKESAQRLFDGLFDELLPRLRQHELENDTSNAETVGVLTILLACKLFSVFDEDAEQAPPL